MGFFEFRILFSCIYLSLNTVCKFKCTYVFMGFVSVAVLILYSKHRWYFFLWISLKILLSAHTIIGSLDVFSESFWIHDSVLLGFLSLNIVKYCKFKCISLCCMDFFEFMILFSWVYLSLNIVCKFKCIIFVCMGFFEFLGLSFIKYVCKFKCIIFVCMGFFENRLSAQTIIGPLDVFSESFWIHDSVLLGFLSLNTVKYCKFKCISLCCMGFFEFRILFSWVYLSLILGFIFH